ncbi:MAG: hypothetical protein IE878_00395 [Epsilonproteobacteria bacterium]|nr:hypothetical protein [Campylobacterota bacterium]
MIIDLDVEINIEIKRKNETIETLKVFVRDYTKEERESFQKDISNFKKLYTDIEKLDKEFARNKKRIEIYKKQEDDKRLLECLDIEEKLEEQLGVKLTELETFGGEEFYEKQSEQKFNLIVGGDVEELRAYAKDIGYVKVLDILMNEKELLLKKQFGR